MDLARISHANYHDANIDKQHFAKRKPMIQARNATIKRLTRNTSQQTVELLSANQVSNYIELTTLEQKIGSTGEDLLIRGAILFDIEIHFLHVSELGVY